MEDSRFSRFSTDPKFRTVPRKEKKVAIDGRFRSMFKDNRFVSKTIVDKRGRPTSLSSKENFRRYYNLSRDSDSDEDGEDLEDNPQEFEAIGEGSSSSSSKQTVRPEKQTAEESTTRERNLKAKSKIRNKLRDLTVDYARGEGLLDSSSSSSEEEEEEVSSEEDEEVQFDKWGELDHDAERSSDITSRLAVCNMDWDRVGAEDIFLAMSSFCPVGGHVRRVRVFLSDFGRTRLAEEDKLGPEELRARNALEEESSDDDEDQKKVDRTAMERVRKYQVNRLKYYYAVAEFDSAESANRVYEECDGTEYELSATRFDLRFIPEDMNFESEVSSCETMPDASRYKPKVFMTSALQQGKVDLTWDETDPNRLATMQKAFQINDEKDVRAYLATDSEEEEEEQQEEVLEEDEADSKNAIAKYKALLTDISIKQKRKEEEKGNMEVVFADENKDDLEQRNAVDSMTPWEKYLHKKKEKRSAKREKRQEDNNANNDETEDKAFSDDEVPGGVDFDDPFFRSEKSTEQSEGKKKKIKKKPKVEEKEDEEGGELSLLVMDSDNKEGHFDYKEIVKQESKNKKKQKRKLPELTDNFRLDLKDDRFSALFENGDYNVDPSHPSFKKTKSMQEIIEEKQARILTQDEQRGQPSKRNRVAKSDLDCLVKAVQKKTAMKAKSSKLEEKTKRRKVK